MVIPRTNNADATNLCLCVCGCACGWVWVWMGVDGCAGGKLHSVGPIQKPLIHQKLIKFFDVVCVFGSRVVD